MSGHVVKELVDVVACVFSRSSLLAGDSREHNEDSGIGSTFIVEEAPNDLLDAFLVGTIKFGTCVDQVNSLIVLAIFDWIRIVRTISGWGCSYRSNCLATYAGITMSTYHLS
jgi:hypothetical protein